MIIEESSLINSIAEIRNTMGSRSLYLLLTTLIALSACGVVCKPPNILMLVIDDLRLPLSSENLVRAPNIYKLMAKSTQFHNAYSQVSTDCFGSAFNVQIIITKMSFLHCSS